MDGCISWFSSILSELVRSFVHLLLASRSSFLAFYAPFSSFCSCPPPFFAFLGWYFSPLWFGNLEISGVVLSLYNLVDIFVLCGFSKWGRHLPGSHLWVDGIPTENVTAPVGDAAVRNVGFVS